MNILDLFMQILILLDMIYDYKEIQFLGLTVYVENGFLKTKMFSRPTDNHGYLDVRSSYQEVVFRNRTIYCNAHAHRYDLEISWWLSTSN